MGFLIELLFAPKESNYSKVVRYNSRLSNYRGYYGRSYVVILGDKFMKYDLERFISAQKDSYATALSEIKTGFKRSHWMWYIFPQIAGLGHSWMAKQYEIVNLDEAKAYMENEYLRNNLIEISQALLDCGNDDIADIMGFPDNIKLCSCMTLFELVAPEEKVFGEVLDKFFNAQRDKRTLELV